MIFAVAGLQGASRGAKEIPFASLRPERGVVAMIISEALVCAPK